MACIQSAENREKNFFGLFWVYSKLVYYTIEIRGSLLAWKCSSKHFKSVRKPIYFFSVFISCYTLLKNKVGWNEWNFVKHKLLIPEEWLYILGFIIDE